MKSTALILVPFTFVLPILLTCCDGDSDSKQINDPAIIQTTSESEPLSLTNTDWELVSLRDATGTRSVVESLTSSLRLNDDNTALGTLDCNGFESTYIADENNISINAVAPTEINCIAGDSDVDFTAYSEQTNFILAALSTLDSYTFENGVLVLRASNGDSLIYEQ